MISAQYQRRSTSFDFDMMQTNWSSSLSPGNEQSFRWSRESASQEGSFNYAGVQSGGADAMIAAMLGAKTRAEFVSAVRALDRILLSGRYGIPLYYAPKQWIAAWSFLRQPPLSTLYGARIETWWARRDRKRSHFRVLRSRIGLRPSTMTIGAIRWRTRKLCLLG